MRRHDQTERVSCHRWKERVDQRRATRSPGIMNERRISKPSDQVHQAGKRLNITQFPKLSIRISALSLKDVLHQAPLQVWEATRPARSRSRLFLRKAFARVPSLSATRSFPTLHHHHIPIHFNDSIGSSSLPLSIHTHHNSKCLQRRQQHQRRKQPPPQALNMRPIKVFAITSVHHFVA